MVNWEQDSQGNTRSEPDYINNQSQPAYHVNDQGDLLSQIAAEDLVEEQQKKKKTTSFSTSFLVGMMRLTLFFDEIKHKNAGFFRILSFMWGLFIGFIYLGGISALVVLIYSYMQFPSFVDHYFKQNNIQLATWKVRDYTFSRIELENLQDAEKTYQIKRMTIRSSFSDFLRKKVKSVVLNGVTVKIREKDGRIDIGNLVHLLISLNQNKSVSIGSVSVMNASLEFEGQNYKLPIQFSMTGFYENKANISIPLVIKEKDINITGVLSITGNGNLLNWNLDILSGTMSFMNRQPENVTGKFTFKTDKMRLIGITGTGELSYGGNSKKIKVDLRNRNKLFQGNINLSIVTKDLNNTENESKSDVVFSFDGLDLKTFTQLESSLPITVNIRSLNTQDISLSNLSTTLSGFLNCTNLTCSYQLDNAARVSIQALKILSGSDSIYSNQPITFMIQPDHQNNFLWQDQKIMTNLSMSDLNYKGYRNTGEFPILIHVANMAVTGEILSHKENTLLGISANGLSFETPEQDIKKASVFIENLWNSSSKFSLNTDYLFLKNNNLLKLPFALKLQKENNQTKAQAAFLNNLIRIDFTGNADLKLGEFKGNIFIPPFDLNKVPGNLETLSDLFPGFVNKASGQIAAFGNVNWKSVKQVSGPLYVSLKDVSFETEDVSVKNLNTVLSLQSIVPFVSPAGQLISISKVDGLLPLQNVIATVKFDPQMLRIFSLDSDIGGLTLSADSIIIPYKASSTIVYLKNSSVNWANVNNYITTPGLLLEGDGSIYLPIEIKNGSFTLRNGEIKLSNLRMKYTGNDKKLKTALFKGNTEYIVRTGSMLLAADSIDKIESYVSLDGRLNPSMEKHVFRENEIFNLKTLLKPMPQKPVPESIVSKQRIIVQ